MKTLFRSYSYLNHRFLYQETRTAEPVSAEMSASQELIREVADLSAEEIEARIADFINANGEQGVRQLRETLITYGAALEAEGTNRVFSTEIQNSISSIEGLLDQALIEHNTGLLESQEAGYQAQVEALQTRFEEYSVEADIPQFSAVVEALAVNNQSIYSSANEAGNTITQYLEQFQADTEQAHKENFIRENFTQQITTALEGADFGDLNFDINSIVTALAERQDLSNLESLDADEVTAFIEQFETAAQNTTTEAITNGTSPLIDTAGETSATTLIDLIKNFLRHLGLNIESENEDDLNTTADGPNSYTGRNAMGNNAETLRGSSAVVDRALDWHSQGTAGINGARHCTHWCELVYFGPGTPDGSQIHNLPKAIDMPVTSISSGTGIGGNQGASVAQIDQLGPGSHIMLDHCRGGACNQGATHSAILLESPTNGVAQVVSYPGNGGAPRVETYTMTENGAGSSKRILRAHNPPA